MSTPSASAVPLSALPTRLRVLLAGTSYPSSAEDWKGLFIQRLVEALTRRPDIALRLWLPPGDIPTGCTRAATVDDAAWLQRLMESGGIAHLLRSDKAAGLAAAWQLLRRLRRAYRDSDCDLYHINWLQNALPLPKDGKPALISVLGTDMQLLRLPGMRAMLRRTLRGHRVSLCPNADWMVAPLTHAFGDVATVRAVPFGIDGRWYNIIRTMPQDGPTRWLAVTRLTSGKLGTLFEWCAPLFHDGGRELHLFGPRQEPIDVPGWVHYHGSATPEQLSTNWFPAACGLITLSQHAEGRPQVMLEAMAAGLPIIASRLPAHADIVDHGVNGWLCDDATDVGTALDWLEAPTANQTAGFVGQEWVRRDIGTWDDCAARYATIYRMLLEDRYK